MAIIRNVTYLLKGARMRTFYESLKAGEFVVTSELNPPKGTDLSHLINKAEILRGMVHAFNLTDSAGSNMTMGNIAVANILSAAGFDPILQVACRDRNRLALQGELLAADVLGIHNILCMTGDPPTGGDHPEAKPVFDLPLNIFIMLGDRESNPDSMDQNHVYCHYTIPQKN